MAKARRTPAADAAIPAQGPVLTVIEGAKPRRSRKTAAAPATPAEAAAPKAPRSRTAKSKAAPAPAPAPEAAKPRSRTKSTAKTAAPATAPKPARASRARAAKPAAGTEPRWADDFAFTALAQNGLAAQAMRHVVLTEDQPLGQAAQEIARIRAEMKQIRHMIDSQPVEQNDAHTLLQRLCSNPAPHGQLARSTASVIELMPQARRGAASAARALRPVPDAVAAPLPDVVAGSVAPAIAQPEAAPAPVVAPVAPARVRAPSRIARLLSAWGDWLMWRLLPPALPNAAAPARASAPSQPVPKAVPAAIPADITAHAVPEGAAPVTPIAPQPSIPVDQLVDQAVTRMLEDGSLRSHLQEMIREELEGEMGARFSGNLRAVVRREIATALDERLTHL